VLDKIMYEEEVRREVFAFEQQFHYAVRHHCPDPPSAFCSRTAQSRVMHLPTLWVIHRVTRGSSAAIGIVGRTPEYL